MTEVTGLPKFNRMSLVIFWRYTSLDSLEFISELRRMFKESWYHEMNKLFVHIPKFDFEADVRNLRRFLSHTHLRFPLLTDVNGIIWREFGSPLIPSLVVVGTDGSVLYEHYGPGGRYFLLTALNDIVGRMTPRGPQPLKVILKDFVEFRARNSISITKTVEFQNGLDGVSSNVKLGTGEYIFFEGGRENWAEFEFRGRSLYVVSAPVEREARLFFEINSEPVKTHMLGDDLIKSTEGTYVRVDMPRLYHVANGGWGLHSVRIESRDALRLYSIIFR